jgi:hypothetical protein
MIRLTGRPREAPRYWEGHADAVRHWGDRAVLNVDGPVSEPRQALLADSGYSVITVVQVRTRRYGGLSNADKRADHEVVIVVERNCELAAWRVCHQLLDFGVSAGATEVPPCFSSPIAIGGSNRRPR